MRRNFINAFLLTLCTGVPLFAQTSTAPPPTPRAQVGQALNNAGNAINSAGNTLQNGTSGAQAQSNTQLQGSASSNTRGLQGQADLNTQSRTNLQNNQGLGQGSVQSGVQGSAQSGVQGGVQASGNVNNRNLQNQGQVYSGQGYSTQGYSGQTYQGQVYQGQPYQGQFYQGPVLSRAGLSRAGLSRWNRDAKSTVARTAWTGVVKRRCDPKRSDEWPYEFADAERQWRSEQRAVCQRTRLPIAA